MQKLYENLLQAIDDTQMQPNNNGKMFTNCNFIQITFHNESQEVKTVKQQNLFQISRVLFKLGLNDNDALIVYRKMELQGIQDLNQLKQSSSKQLIELGLDYKQIQVLQRIFNENQQDAVCSLSQNSDFNLKSQLQDLGQYQGFKLFQYPLFKKQDILDYDSYRSLIVIGETGTGKTSFINNFLNYYLEVKQEDNFRYQLVVENKNQSQAVSQTSDVNIYYIKPYKGKLGLRIIDTPGFLDTKGVQQDQIITKQIEHCFKTQVESLSTICFLIKASACRLTPSQMYVLSAILSMFGKDIIQNFVFVFTFYDGSSPQAIEALTFQGGNGHNPSPIHDKIQLINKPWYLQINNSFLYSSKQNGIGRLFFTEAQQCFKDLYAAKIQNNKQQSLTMTRQVNEKRSQIMNIVNDLRKIITQQSNEIVNVKNLQKQIEKMDSARKTTFIFEIQFDLQFRTKLEMARNDKIKLINDFEQKLIQLDSLSMQKQKDLIEYLRELTKISLLKPTNQYQEEYLDLLINKEFKNRLPGFQDRIIELQEMKEYWKIIRETKSQTGSVVYTKEFLENNLAAWKRQRIF